MPRTPRLCYLCSTESTNHAVLSEPSDGPLIRADITAIIGFFPAQAKGSVICTRCQKVFRDFVKMKEKRMS